MEVTHKTLVYISNAIDENSKITRGITTDSPAANNKVLSIAKSIKLTGLRCIVLSLGRGRQNYSGKWHHAFCRRHDGILFLYCAYFNFPLLTHIVTSISLAIIIMRLSLHKSNIAILVYNRSIHYILALIYAKLVDIRSYLDLEDGYLSKKKLLLKNLFIYSIYKLLCPNGAIVANSLLKKQLGIKPSFICYGVVKKQEIPKRNWEYDKLKILFCGTIMEETGGKLFLDALKIIRKKNPELVNSLHFIVTGKGSLIGDYHNFSNIAPDWLSVNQSIQRSEYLRILSECHIGLNLRLSKFEMSATTFPSKIIEFAEYEMSIISTRVSDVPLLFGNSIIFLEAETAESLAKLLSDLPCRRSELSKLAKLAHHRIIDYCEPKHVATQISKMIFKN